MIFINFKTYKESTGDNAIRIAVACEMTAEQGNTPIVPVVQIADCYRITQHISIPVWVQHVDYQLPGAFTGFTTVQSAMENGASGTLLNHSEHPLSFEILEKTITTIRNANPDFKILVCAPSVELAKQITPLMPDFIAYEPAELIGSATESVASAQSSTIEQAAIITQQIPLIVGAGVKSEEDVRTSIAKGAKGILVASSVVLSENPHEPLLELAKGFHE